MGLESLPYLEVNIQTTSLINTSSVNLTTNKKMIMITNPQAHLRPSDYITHEERYDAKGALQFSRTLNLALNMQVECDFPLITDPVERLEYSRALSHKLRMFARANHYECAFASVRYANPDQPGREGIGYLIHVPELLRDQFTYIASNWTIGISVQHTNENQTVQGDGRIHNSFNHVFRFVSSETAKLEPTALSETSGRIWGPRVFVTRNLWVRRRMEHRRLMANIQAEAAE